MIFSQENDDDIPEEDGDNVIAAVGDDPGESAGGEKSAFGRYCAMLAEAGEEVSYEDRLIVPGGLKRLEKALQPMEMEALVEELARERIDSGDPRSPILLEEQRRGVWRYAKE